MAAFKPYEPKWMSFRRRLLASRFFTLSLLLHVILVTALGGTVLFQKYVEPPDFVGEAGAGGFISQETVALPPQPSLPFQNQPTFNVTSPQGAAPPMTAITAFVPTQVAFSVPTMVPSVQVPFVNPSLTPSTPVFSEGLTGEAARGIAGFSEGWSKPSGAGSSLRTREFEFTAYLAKYSGGDWDSTVKLRNGKIVGGSLPNLLYIMKAWSRDKIKASPQAQPLDLASDEIFAHKPPFIFFTGHRDFTLTEKEVENLQKYVRLGGCIWGDSSLPGLRSRFDIAFRREMRRIVPDVDKGFEPLPTNHPIFTGAYFQEIKDVPEGLNYYREPIYALKVYDEIAVLYTPNDYGDMWQFGLNEKGEIDRRRDESGAYVAINAAMWERRHTYFRNIRAETLVPTYKLGTNIVIHLLTRWEDKVRNVPRGL